jgi:hypothetical protein
MFDPGHLYQHLAEGVPFLLLGGMFIWAGFKKKLGRNPRPSIFLACGFIIYGTLALLGLV